MPVHHPEQYDSMEDWAAPERTQEEWTKHERRKVTIGLYKVFRRKGKVHPQAEGNDSFNYSNNVHQTKRLVPKNHCYEPF